MFAVFYKIDHGPLRQPHGTLWPGEHDPPHPPHLLFQYEVNIYDVASELNTIVMSLRIVRVEMEDYGSYACEALNKLGKVSKNMELYRKRTLR